MHFPLMVNVDDVVASKVVDLFWCQKNDEEDVGKGKKRRKGVKSYD